MFVFFYLKVKVSFCDVVKSFGCKYNKKKSNDQKKKKKNEKKFFSSFDSAKIWRFFIMTHGDNLSP